RYLIWQALKTTDKNLKQTLWNAARLQLNELSSRRPDWSLIPLALADIGEQELRELRQEKQNLTDSDATIKDDQSKEKSLEIVNDKIKSKEDETASFYLRAIDLGQRNLTVVRRATDLLYASNRSAEVSQLWSQLPSGSIVGGNLQNQEFFAA